MTLVLGACLENSVILAADSWVFRDGGDGVPKYAGIDRKLFKLDRTGIATFAGDPSYKSHVPTEIDTNIPRDLGPDETCWKFLRHFEPAMGTCALVGGFENDGKAVLYELAVPDAYFPLAESKIFYRGFEQDSVDCKSPTVIGVLNQMLDLLESKSGKKAGPPYEFLVIERPIQKIGSNPQ